MTRRRKREEESEGRKGREGKDKSLLNGRKCSLRSSSVISGGGGGGGVPARASSIDKSKLPPLRDMEREGKGREKMQCLRGGTASVSPHLIIRLVLSDVLTSTNSTTHSVYTVQ